MPDQAEPVFQLSLTHRWRLKLRLHRAWRKGMAERHALTLDALATVAGSDMVIAAHPSRRGLGACTEIVFGSGAEVRLSSCYRPYVALLAKRAADRVVVLDYAAYHGNCWGLYFLAGDDRLALLANEVTVLPAAGGETLTPIPPHLDPLGV